MDIKETSKDGLAREYELTLSAKDLDIKITTRLGEVAKTANMPGFRPGKVPMTVVKARFGDQVKGEVIRTELDNGARDAVEKNSLKLSSQPRLDIVSYEDGQDLIAKLMVEIMPEITIPDLSAIAVERPILPANEDEINETMKSLAEDNRPTQKVEKAAKPKWAMWCLSTLPGALTVLPLKAVRQQIICWNLAQTPLFRALKMACGRQCRGNRRCKGNLSGRISGRTLAGKGSRF